MNDWSYVPIKLYSQAVSRLSTLPNPDVVVWSTGSHLPPGSESSLCHAVAWASFWTSLFCFFAPKLNTLTLYSFCGVNETMQLKWRLAQEESHQCWLLLLHLLLFYHYHNHGIAAIKGSSVSSRGSLLVQMGKLRLSEGEDHIVHQADGDSVLQNPSPELLQHLALSHITLRQWRTSNEASFGNGSLERGKKCIF